MALLRLSENDLRSLHTTICEMSLSSFIELLRDIEDEIDNSLLLTMDRATERSFMSFGSDGLYLELDQMRKKELRMPVQAFADKLAESLARLIPKDVNKIPQFDSRRGLQAWIIKLVQIFNEQEVHHAAMRIRKELSNSKKSDWELR